MSTDLPRLEQGAVALRPLAEDDLDALAAIILEPGVREWWIESEDSDRLRTGLRNEGNAFVIEIDGELAGWLGFDEENDPDYPHVGLDIALSGPYQGRGLGPQALRTVIDWLVAERGHHRVTIDPALANERAIRAYEAVGFRPVGVLRQYERDPAGGWRDGLLMDLLASELDD